MNTSNITNYKPKDFAELLGILLRTLHHDIILYLRHPDAR